MMKAGTIALICVLAILGAGIGRAAEEVHKPGFHLAAPLKLEPVGQTSVRAWYRALKPGRANDASPWKQLIWFKKDSRTAKKSYFAAVDFTEGTLKELPVMVPCLEPWASVWLDGKYYLGTNLPARLTVYDPATDTLTDLGPCFSEKSLTCYRIAVSPDGMIVMGGGTGSDVSLYNPKTNAFTHFGQVAAKPGGGTYAYYLSADEKYIYVAVRSSDPWELVRLDRETRERKVLVTAPPRCHMAIAGNVAEVTGRGPKEWYTLADGQATERPATKRPKPWALPGPGFTGTAPKIAIDSSPILDGEDALAVHIQSPGGKEWRQAKLPLTLDTAAVTQITRLDDGRLVGVPKAYFALVIVDPKTGDTQRVPLQISAYGMLGVGARVFIGGYPSARTMVFDTTRPMTWAEDLPGRPGVKETDPAANPRLIRHFGKEANGAHIAMQLTKGADDNVYFIARRHRYFYGFALAWLNPDPNENGEFAGGVFDDKGAFNHLQISGMQPVDGGKQLLITTQVQYNKQRPGEAPASAAVFLYDVARKEIVGKYEPLPGARHITVATMVAPNTLIGSAADYKRQGACTFFRFNTEAGRLELKRHYDWRLGQAMSYQPDGKIWATCWYGNFSVLYTIDPEDLTATPVGRTPARGVRAFFDEGKLYLTGHPRIMRVEGLEVPAEPKP